MKRTVLGNPYIQPWKHLATMTEHFEMEEFLFGSYYICRGIRRERRSLRRNGRSSPAADSGESLLSNNNRQSRTAG
jgi:hypothetical protein